MSRKKIVAMTLAAGAVMFMFALPASTVPPPWCSDEQVRVLAGEFYDGDGSHECIRERFDAPNDWYGRAGADTMVGEAGNDALYGGDGNDDVFGGPGADLLRGGLGSDLLVGHGGPDDLYGGEGNDVVYAGEGTDFVRGGDDTDLIIHCHDGILDDIDGFEDHVHVEEENC